MLMYDEVAVYLSLEAATFIPELCASVKMA
jgi:hypothetical protein